MASRNQGQTDKKRKLEKEKKSKTIIWIRLLDFFLNKRTG